MDTGACLLALSDGAEHLRALMNTATAMAHRSAAQRCSHDESVAQVQYILFWYLETCWMQIWFVLIRFVMISQKENEHRLDEKLIVIINLNLDN